jgi:hypothetical protein
MKTFFALLVGLVLWFVVFVTTLPLDPHDLSAWRIGASAVAGCFVGLGAAHLLEGNDDD